MTFSPGTHPANSQDGRSSVQSCFKRVKTDILYETRYSNTLHVFFPIGNDYTVAVLRTVIEISLLFNAFMVHRSRFPK